MYRFTTETEHLDIDIYSATAAWYMARAVRPHDPLPDADDAVYIREPLVLAPPHKVAHWSHPQDTGEIIDTDDTPHGRVHRVRWPNGAIVPYLGTTAPLIRVTELENSHGCH